MAPKFSSDQVKAFIKDNDLKTMADVQSALKELFADTLQEMLEAELDHELGYAKHDVANKQTAQDRMLSGTDICTKYGFCEYV